MKNTSSGAATVWLGSAMTPKAQAREETPHFFLQVFFKDGLDASYLFDTRDISFTDKGKIQNYRTDKNTYLWEDTAGRKAWVSSLAKPLANYRNEFSLLNGVHMARGFDGHPQNIAMMTTGSATGGKLFVTDFHKPAHIPLHFVAQGRFNGFEIPSMEMGVSLRADVARSMADRFKGIEPVSDQSAVWNFIKSRANAASSGGSGAFSSGSRQLLNGYNGSVDIIQKQQEVRLCTDAPDAPCNPDFRIENSDSSMMTDSLKTAFEYFTRGLAQSALVSIRYELDVHDKLQAQAQEKEVQKVATDIATLLEFLKKPYDEARGLSFGDVTTVVIASEFSRSMRQVVHPVDETGTDHNPFTNTVLLAGRGVKKGLILGATDLDELDAQGEFTNVAPAHKQLDSQLVLPMGKVFDHQSLTVKNDLPDSYDDLNYLSWLNVINTVYQLFGVEADKHKTFTRTGPKAAILGGLIG